MKIPSTTKELAGAIESLIGSYMAGVREAAQQAVERALVRSSAGRCTRRGKTGASMSPTSGTRRTAVELAGVCDALCEVVRAHPGASMVMLAERMGTEARTLQRPMATLRSTGRVRSVGQRHLTRYYPAVVRSAGARD
jgi:hypothetical protein